VGHVHPDIGEQLAQVRTAIVEGGVVVEDVLGCAELALVANQPLEFGRRHLA